MQEKNKEQAENENANKHHGAQGIDKAPGEETAGDTANFIQESQKGKKVDADLTQETDRPASQQDL